MNITKTIQATLRQVFNDDSLLFDTSRFAGGLTNYNYIMTIRGEEYVIRQPGGLTEQIIDRNQEQVNNAIAADFNINSDCIYFDAATGIKISRYIANSSNMAQANPAAPPHLAAVAALMRQVHAFPRAFANRFDWQTELQKYERIIQSLQGDVFSDYLDLKAELVAFVQESIKTTSWVPCHNDTVPENFLLDAGGKTYLIDWEYSGMNDPCWDVAAYIVESRLDAAAIDALTNHYFGRPRSAEEELKLKAFIMVQDLLWTAWALIRHYNGDDFLEYCTLRYERFRKNIQLMRHMPDCPLVSLVELRY